MGSTGPGSPPPRSSSRASVSSSALFAAAAWFLVRPLRRKVSDEQVALYLEEHEPSLQATLLSAVEASQHGRPESAALVQRVVEQAIEKCAEIDASRRVERLPLRRNGVALAGGGADRHCRRHARSGVHPQRGLGTATDSEGCRSGRAVPDRGEAGQCHGAEGRRPDDRRDAERFRGQRRRGDG